MFIKTEERERKSENLLSRLLIILILVKGIRKSDSKNSNYGLDEGLEKLKF